MKVFLVAAVVAAGAALGLSADRASAAWVTRTTYRLDPHCGHYIPVVQKVWVPDPVICPHHHHHDVPVPVAPVFGGSAYRGFPRHHGSFPVAPHVPHRYPY